MYSEKTINQNARLDPAAAKTSKGQVAFQRIRSTKLASGDPLRGRTRLD